MKNDKVRSISIPVLIGLIPLVVASMIGMQVLGEEQEKNRNQDKQIEEIKRGNEQIKIDLRNQAEINGRIDERTKAISTAIDRILIVLERR